MSWNKEQNIILIIDDSKAWIDTFIYAIQNLVPM